MRGAPQSAFPLDVRAVGELARSPTAADRMVFWAKLHERLAKLSNLDGEAQARMRTAVHARVPMPTAAEIRRAERRGELDKVGT
jgi:hypothetical protein